MFRSDIPLLIRANRVIARAIGASKITIPSAVRVVSDRHFLSEGRQGTEVVGWYLGVIDSKVLVAFDGDDVDGRAALPLAAAGLANDACDRAMREGEEHVSPSPPKWRAGAEAEIFTGFDKRDPVVGGVEPDGANEEAGWLGHSRTLTSSRAASR